MCRIANVRPKPGDRVIHEFYGEGVVKKPAWDTTQIRVCFDHPRCSWSTDEYIAADKLRIVGREYHPYLI